MSNQIAIFAPSLRSGGAERVIANLANALAMRGNCVELVLLSAEGEFLSDISSRVKIRDLGVKRIRYALPALVEYFNSARPNVLLACMWPLTVAAVWAKLISRSRTKVIVAEHTTWSNAEIVKSSLFTEWLARVTMRISFVRASGIIAVSRGSADDLSRFCGISRDRISVIYNPVVDENKSVVDSVAPASDWSRGDHIKLLAVGSLKPVKDYSTLLKAFALVTKKINAKLMILGEGECRADLEDEAIGLGIVENVFLPGFVKDPSPYYRAADLHVLSSTGEGLPTVIIEALASGTPVVSTDCPTGPREILSDGRFGRLVQPSNPVSLAQGIGAALRDPHDRDALVRRSLDFSISKAVDEYERLMFEDAESRPLWRSLQTAVSR